MRSSPARDAEYRYRPAWWLPGGHAQTLWGKFARPYPSLPVVSETLRTPDGDALEVHSLESRAGAPRVLLLHGLEGSVRSHYVGGVFMQAHARGWGASLVTFRGCGDAANEAKRFYHSGETTDVQFAFDALRARWPDSPWFAMGVSLGGNVLLKWMGEHTGPSEDQVRAAAAVSVPYDLEAGARHIGRSGMRVYDRNFLRSLRRKALVKLQRYPGLFDRQRLHDARTVYDFDDVVTAPVHGFADAHDYYTRSSAIRFLRDIRVRTLLLSSRDDPFLPAWVLDRAAAVARENLRLSVEFHDRGGHVGFVAGPHPWRPVYYAESRAFRFFESAMEAP